LFFLIRIKENKNLWWLGEEKKVLTCANIPSTTRTGGFVKYTQQTLVLFKLLLENNLLLTRGHER